MKNVTIVIPIYNRIKFLPETLKLIPDKFPLILVDNNSTDGSFQFCQEFAQKRQNTILLRELKPGAAAARNTGLRVCTTEYIYFFDSDDRFEDIPTDFDDNMDMVCFPVRQTKNGHTAVRSYHPTNNPSVAIVNSMLNTVTMIFRREWLQSIGGWNETCRIWDDWELGIRALLHRPRLQWITAKAYHNILIQEESITGSDYSSQIEKILHTMNCVLQDVNALSSEKAIQQKCLKALYLRLHIIRGTVKREKHTELCPTIDAYKNEALPLQGTITRIVGNFCSWYTSIGGRGAWRIALLTVKTLN